MSGTHPDTADRGNTGQQLSVPLPCGPAWFAADTTDGAAHHGELHTSGQVHAICGAAFTPLRNPLAGAIAWWRQSVDDTHGCPACLAASRQQT